MRWSLAVLALSSGVAALDLGCARCLADAPRCALDAGCRGAFECIVGKCVPPCAKVPLLRPGCDETRCAVSNGTCGPSPKCTLRCFDVHAQYNNKAFNDVLSCMFANKCMQPMDGDWPRTERCDEAPPQAAALPSFNLSMLEGRWYITAGLSDEFDTYDCQVACSRRVAHDRVNFSIWYDITLDDGSKLQQISNQSFFNPDPSTPAHLRQHAWMNGVDNWYVIAAKPDTYWFVKYCGDSDSWHGYGGGFLYTRTPTLDPKLIPELRVAAKKAGFDWDDMKLTKNHYCGIEPTPAYGCPAVGNVYSV